MNCGPENKCAGFGAQHVSHRAIHHSLRGSTGAARSNDGPTREAARDFLHVLLRVTAVDAEGMQLHQLACVIFVDAASLLLLLRSLLLRVVTHSQVTQRILLSVRP